MHWVQRPFVLLLLIGGALLAASGCSALPTPAVATATPPPASASGQATASPSAVVDAGPAVAVYDQNGPKVVNINSLAIIRTSAGPTTRPAGVGSGFVYDTDEHIVTNDHVVQDAGQLLVTFQDGTARPAELIGRDPDNHLAVIRVTDPPSLQPVALGDSDQLRIGQTAFAIGSPLGLQQTLTQGIVSAVRPPDEDFGAGSIVLPGGAVQTDAAINPGNSGGPLFDSSGRVIGVNTVIATVSGGSQGLGFAIPINVVKRIVPELIQNGRYRHPELGITGVPLAALGRQTRQQLGIPPDVEEGVLVLQASGGAQQAGIQGGSTPIQAGGQSIPAGGDIVVAVDGRSVGTPGQLRSYVENNKRPGDTVTLTVLRNGQRQDVPVTLGERPPQP
ncbi:MAG: trypsin-like peptidase domain-containing protein [Chloroflexi bacterium]|nr:trypsin-like peptidase domain-containing protein [Chloroflexota bacterium]